MLGRMICITIQGLSGQQQQQQTSATATAAAAAAAAAAAVAAEVFPIHNPQLLRMLSPS